jgi:hypothetical protein
MMQSVRKLLFLIIPIAIIDALFLANKGYFRLQAKPRGTLQLADIFIGLGFGIIRGSDGNDEPGQSNLSLAKWLLDNNPQHKPAIIQYGLYLALKNLGENDLESWVNVLPDHKDIHVDTRAAMLQAWALMDKEGCKRPAIVCMPLQTTRAMWIANKMMDQYILPDFPEMPYESRSTQIWTRSPYHYVLFELLIARPVGFLFGWFDTRTK